VKPVVVQYRQGSTEHGGRPDDGSTDDGTASPFADGSGVDAAGAAAAGVEGPDSAGHSDSEVGPNLIAEPSFDVEAIGEEGALLARLEEGDVACLVYQHVDDGDTTAGWTDVVDRIRERAPELSILVWTPGYEPAVAVTATRRDGVEYVPGDPPAGVTVDLQSRVADRVADRRSDDVDDPRHRRTLARVEPGADTDLTGDGRVDRLLAVGCEYLGVDVGFVTAVDTDTEQLEVVVQHGKHEALQVGERVPLEETYCRRVVEDGSLLGVYDATTDDRVAERAVDRYGLGSYLGGRIDVGGELYGTLCFASQEGRSEPFDERERAFVELVVEWVTGELERRSYAAALETERDRAERVLDRVADGFFAVDENWSITYLNRRFEEIIGRGSEQLLGEDLWEAFPEAASAAFYDEYHRAMETGEPVQFEEYFEPLETWFDVRAYPAADGLSVYFQDVTERKRHERTLLLYEAIVEGIDDGVFVVGEDGRFELVDYGAFDEDPFSDGLVGQPYTTLAAAGIEPDESVTEMTAAIEAVLEGRADHDRLAVAVGGAGRPRRIVDLRLSRLETDDGTGVLGVARDVTATREALRSLQETTRTLRDADTESEIAEQAVQAGLTVGEAAVGAVYLFDEDRGALCPAAVAGPGVGEEGPDGLAAVSGEGRAWEAFVEGQLSYAAEVTPAASVFPAVAGVESEFALPLGERGVVVFGHTAPRPQSEARVEFARTLAASVEVALDRVDSERAVREREGRLEAQTERLEQLDRVNSVVRRTATAIVRETTREELERELCAQLVDIDPFVHAWIGEVDADGKRLVERTHADARGDAGAGPNPDRAGGSLGAGADDATGTVAASPALAAIEAGSVQVLDNLLTDHQGPSERPAWQERALERGYQSCCAVPLVRRGTVRGVVKLYADRPNGFPEPVQRVLAELGELIGYAVTSAERRAALQSRDLRELEFDVEAGTDGGGHDDETPLVARLARTLGATVEFESLDVGGDRTRVTYTVEADVPDGRVADLTELSGVAAVDRTAADGARTVVRVTPDESWYGTAFTAAGGTVVRERAGADGTGQVAVHLPADVDLRTVVEPFLSSSPGVDLAAKRDVDGPQRTETGLRETLSERLTDRQYTALETAHEEGYFEHPRAASGAELADAMGIAQSTFNQHLRLAENRVFEALFDDGSDAPDRDGERE
jgi:PAS domain S-box-containing protein